MIDRAIGLFGLAVALVVGLYTFVPPDWPKMPTWATVLGIGLGIFLFGTGCGLVAADLRTREPPHKQTYDLKPFDAFQIAAGEETSLAILLYVENIPLPKNPTGETNVFDRALLTVEARDHWRSSLKNLDVECMKLNLNATHSAIQQAIRRFDEAEINRVTAYWAYHSVSLALKDEIERTGALCLAASNSLPEMSGFMRLLYQDLKFRAHRSGMYLTLTLWKHRA